jgi:anaerobic ribonucleoside-triphosphate reductase
MTTHRPESESPQAKSQVKVPCEVYSRIVGYLRPIQNWHDGKRQEFRERVTYRVPEESE